MKYKAKDTLDADFREYLAQEGLFGFFFGHYLTKNQRQKVDYIHKRLLIEHAKKYLRQINSGERYTRNFEIEEFIKQNKLGEIKCN